MKKTGELLRKRREEKGLSLHEIALSLKINSKTLKAIEDGDLTQLPAKTFLRGFVQSYASFLKMNLEEVLAVFSEEMGPTRPQAPLTVNDASPAAVEQNNRATEVVAFPRPAPARASMEPSAPTVSGIEQTSKTKAIILSVVSFVLVCLIVMTKRVIDRYQRESQSAPVAVVPIEQPATQDAIPDNPSTGEAPPAAVTTTETTKPSEAAKPEAAIAPVHPTAPPVAAKADLKPAAPNVAAPSVSPAKTPSAPAPVSSMIPALTGADILKNITHTGTPNASVAPKAEAKQPEAKPADAKPVAKAEAVKPAEQVAATKPAEPPAAKPAEQKPVEQKTATEAAKPVEAAKPEETKPAEPPKKSLELIVEALDAVEIEFSGATGAPQKIQLGADQVHTIRSKGALKVQISNGGAVNLTLNGRDLGVPGDLGKPIKLSY